MTDDLVNEARLALWFAYCDMKIDLKESAGRIEKLEAALRDFLLWGDHCQHCDYDDEWAKIEVRARKALEGKDD